MIRSPQLYPFIEGARKQSVAYTPKYKLKYKSYEIDKNVNDVDEKRKQDIYTGEKAVCL